MWPALLGGLVFCVLIVLCRDFPTACERAAVAACAFVFLSAGIEVSGRRRES